MKLAILHEFDAPLDAVELAVLSPDLVGRVGRGLASIERVVQVRHELLGGDILEREWRFVAALPLPSFAAGRELAAWRLSQTYARTTRAARWTIEAELKPAWRKWLRAEGGWHLERAPEGRTRRALEGTVTVDVAVLGGLAERLVLGEVRKALDAEAEAIREMATVR